MKRDENLRNRVVLVGCVAAILFFFRGETSAGQVLQVPLGNMPSGDFGSGGISALSGGMGSDIVEVDSRQNQALKGPRLAFNSRDRLFLAVWEYHYAKSDWDINGRVLDATGRPVGKPFGIAWRGSIVQQQVGVAYNPCVNQFLVVYALSPGNGDLNSTLVAGDGTPSEVFVRVAETAAQELRPSVVCDPIMNEYLVIYERQQTQGQVVWNEVWAQRVKHDGTLTGSAMRLSPATPGMNSINGAVAGAGGQSLVVWQTTSSGGSALWGEFIERGVPSTTRHYFGLDEHQSCPKVAYNPAWASYLIVYWAQPDGGDYSVIRAKRMSNAGWASPTVTLATAAREHCTMPDIAYDPSDGTYVVVWAQGPSPATPGSLPPQRIMALRVDGDGSPLGEPVPVSGPGKYQPISQGIPAPAVAVGTDKRSLVVWEEQTVVLDGGVPTLPLSRILSATNAWGTLSGDLDGDSDVDFVDLAILSESWLHQGE